MILVKPILGTHFFWKGGGGGGREWDWERKGKIIKLIHAF